MKVKGSRSRRGKVHAQRPSRWPWLLLGGATLAVLGILVWITTQSANTIAAGSAAGLDRVQRYPIQSRNHIAVGAQHPAYNSDPPTSGWHYDTPADAGFYENPLPDEQLIHNLEHGHIVISYDCSRLGDCAQVKDALRSLVAKNNSWKIVAAPRKNRDAAIALTAWGVLERLDGYDAESIDAFIRTYRDKGPEKTDM